MSAPEPAPGRPQLLTPNQTRVVAFALTLLAVVVSGYLLVRVAAGALGLIGQFSAVLWPLAVAGILAMVLRPAVDFLERRLRVRRVPAVLLIFAVGLGLAVTLGTIFLPQLARQLMDFITFLPELWTRAARFVTDRYPEWVQLANEKMANPHVREIVTQVGNSLGEALNLNKISAYATVSLKAAGSGVLTVAGFFTTAAVIPIYLFFFLLSRADPVRPLQGQLSFLRPEHRDDLLFLTREFIGIVISFFRGQLLIGVIMGVLLAIGFQLAGLRYSLFIGLTLGLLNVIPYLGSIVGLAIALPLAFFQPGGGPATLGLTMLVIVVVQTIEGWFLTPKIMGDRTGLHPVTIIVAIFFWGTALEGILGMVLAIPLTAFFVIVWRLLRHKYLGQITGQSARKPAPGAGT
jgi:predicted PurR-regulated permease PerM